MATWTLPRRTSSGGTSSGSAPLQAALDETLLTAVGRAHRKDPVVGRTGGPAGNASLTAWTGLALLVLSLAELGTLVSLGRFLSWHIAIGAALVPVALLKIGSTGWRVVRYYRDNPHYKKAGPPPLLLRLLGPLVVGATLALLGSGGALVYLGADRGRQPLVTLLGFAVSPVTLHQAAFAVWAGATGLHVLARLVPALQLTVRRRLAHPGGALRLAIGALVAVGAVGLAVFAVGHAGSWTGSLSAFG
jgi:hypothetical protein